MEFVHLHIHTSFSLLDGVCKIEKISKRLEELKQKAAAITDHSNMFGAVSFCEILKKRNIKPIVGCEINLNFLGDISHLIVLCENKEGYKNLVKIVSYSYLENFKGVPIVDFDFLKKYKKGLIFLSGCFKGEVARNILNGNFEKAKEVAKFFRDEFRKENFFIELQDYGKEEDFVLKNYLIQLAKKLDLNCVATNDVHYLEKEDEIVREIVHCIRDFNVIDSNFILKGKKGEKYLKSYDEMKERFSSCLDALENTVKISDRCEFNFDSFRVNIPKYPVENGEDSKQFLEKKAKEGLFLKYGKEVKKEVLKRFYYELEVIVKMGFVDYFLIVYDYVKYAKEKGIFVGPGRGSGAASLIGFCLGITEVDPIRFNLSFERFLNIYRTKMPDFDVDFCNERRGEVIEYVIKKYGKERVARIITFGTLAAKAALRDVGRVLGFSYEFVDSIVKKISPKISGGLDAFLKESLELQNFLKTEKKAKILFDFAKKVEGLEKNTSIHAAAVVLTEKRLDNLIPLYKVEDSTITQYDMNSIEKLNFLKMDFLGLRNLTILSHCEKLINLQDKSFKVLNIPLDDVKTFDMLSNGDSVGVFQLESEGMRRALFKVKPSCLEDVMAVLALNRPGPAHFIDEYVENKKNRNNIKYLNENMKKILSSTYGVIVYQEQVMEIFEKIAGYSMKKIDLVRKAISKKNFEIMEREKKIFIYGKKDGEEFERCPGAVKLGVDETSAEKIFDDLKKFALYAFNRSHAAAYSIISYKTAYLKRNFLLQYMVCLLNSVVNNKDKLKIYIKECIDKNIKILSIDINFSDVFFKIEEKKSIRFSFLAIKHISFSFSRAIVEERRKGEFVSFEDFLLRVFNSKEEKEFSRNAILSLILAGAFNSIENKEKLILNFEEILKKVREKKREIKGQINLFDVLEKKKEILEKDQVQIFKIKGKILKILEKKINARKFYVIYFLFSKGKLKIFADEKFSVFERKIENKSCFEIHIRKIYKNGKVYLKLEEINSL